jgi:hypothetical protein
MTDYVTDDRPYYEFQDEVDGLRKQVDQLREIVKQLRSEMKGYQDRAEESEVRMRQMEDARAGVTGARLFLRRVDDIGVAHYHYTVNGTRARCSSSRRINSSFCELVELVTPPEELCKDCGRLLDIEIQYNHYEEQPTYSDNQDKRHREIERSNAALFNVKADPNPLFTTYVYFIQAEGETRFKVGISTNPRSRIANLRHAAGRVLKVLMLSEACTSSGARDVEYAVKREFDGKRVAQEWYSLSWQQVKRVKEIITLTVAQDRNKKHKLTVIK